MTPGRPAACLLPALAIGISVAGLAAQSRAIPHLRKQGTATQLVVDGRPFLIRGGELGNSSASSLDYLAPRWAGFRALGLNTILAPVYWDLIEPKEGTFDFALVDGLVAGARTPGDARAGAAGDVGRRRGEAHRHGQYPSAGPLPHLLDVWRAAAPAIDFIAPDIYFPTFVEWTRRYVRGGNPLFVPEALRSPEAAVNSLYAFAAHDAIGFSPFAIESTPEPAAKMLSASTTWSPSSHRSSSSTRGAARWRGSCRSMRTIGPRSSYS